MRFSKNTYISGFLHLFFKVNVFLRLGSMFVTGNNDLYAKHLVIINWPPFIKLARKINSVLVLSDRLNRNAYDDE